ncbi:MAG: hypothetical protein HDS82_07765 [Bacteroidales bacterium]|nr:hypothetical protein [Bacteroidales bacterium]
MADKISPEQQNETSGASELKEPEKKAGHKKRHLIHPTWLRRTLKTLGVLILLILAIPVALYIPPVQTMVKNIACDAVKKSTGMAINIDLFRLRWPLDIELKGVSVVEAAGDTMVKAGSAIADVKLLPLLKLDVQLNRLRLLDGYYRMVSPDSSMILTIDAGMLDIDDKSSANIKSSEIILNKALLRDGKVSLYMDVWKKQTTPTDTTSTPFLIKANDIDIKNITFAMSMLPTIDTLTLFASDMSLKQGIIDLRTNRITAKSLKGNNGKAVYLTPTPEYIASHPAPVDTTSPPSPPMIITGDTVSLTGFDVLYAVKGAKPLPGFDPSYIDMSGVEIGLTDFYNEASTVVLPVNKLRGRERSGLELTEGSGTLRVDSVGLTLDNLNVSTPWSKISATADLPFSLMAMQPSAPVNVTADASIGLPDVEAFMPDLKTYTRLLPQRTPLTLKLSAEGTLSDVDVPNLEAAMAGIFDLKARGSARNPLDMKRLVADLDMKGKLSNPSIVQKFTGPLGFELPTLTIDGTAHARGEEYAAVFDLRTSAGDLAGQGKVALNSERYDADLKIRGINVARFMPSLGIGQLDANVSAHGGGFNPLLPRASTEAELDILSIYYNGHHLTNIKADVSLQNGVYTLSASSPNELADFDLYGSGSIDNGQYTFDVTANINHADLKALGLTPDICGGSGSLYAAGTATPDKWLYDVDLKVADIEWRLPDQFISLPHGMTASLRALPYSVEANVESDMTTLDFEADSGLQALMQTLTEVTDSTMVQIDRRNLDIRQLQARLPRFRLDANASGRGLISEFLNPMNIGVDTVAFALSNDSLLRADGFVYGVRDGSTRVDSLKLSLTQRGSLMDYRVNMGNRPGTLDEFANVSIGGYFGGNRASLSLTQHNIKGEMGYRLGLTAALSDDQVDLHFTPLKATIAYMPWTLNADNHVEYHYNGKIDANLLAKSNESSILLMTEKASDGIDELHINLDNIKIQDFLKMSVFAPPLTASISSDMRVRYNERELSGRGKVDISDLTYDRVNVGDFQLLAMAGLDSIGRTKARAALNVNGQQALTLHTILLPDSAAGGFKPEDLGLTLTKFPLKVANPFLGADMLSLAGSLNGELDLSGSFTAPVLNGYLACDSVSAYIPMAGTRIKFDNEPITVDSNLVRFNKFDIFAVNDNPLTINGTFDARKLSEMKFDLDMNGENVQLVGNDQRAHTDLYGKLFMNLNASVKGPMQHFDIKANANILGNTDIYYNLNMTPSQLQEQATGNVVKFVQFADTTQVEKTDSLASQMAMRIMANLTITPGTQVTVNLQDNGTSKAQLSPSGTLNYFQNFMGDMRLNGTLTLGDGYARYAVPLIGEKMVTIVPSSHITWNGNVMNPTLAIKLNNVTRATILNGGNSQQVNFDIGINVGNNLDNPRLTFDLSTEDDMTVENEIQSMTPDQKSTQAMNLLLTGRYTGPGTRTDGAPATSMLYSYLSSTLNSWAAKNIRGVDLSFGINQYDRTVDGESSTAMSYSYQVSKSLFNNKFKIVVGGNYATDASSDDNLSQNLISDISFEYMLRQTQNVSILAKLFRHTGYESILEGEITETGVGIVMRRQLQSLRGLFRNPFKNRRKRRVAATPADSTDAAAGKTAETHDSIKANDDQK